MKVIAFVYLFLITFVLWLAADIALALGWFSFNLVFCLYFHFDNKAMFQNTEVLKERAMFYGWLYLRGNHYLYAAIFFFLAVGLLQLGLIRAMGSNDLVLESFGLHYVRVTEDDQWWRLASGPFLHGRFVHWLSNLMIAVALSVMCGPFLKTKRLVPVFLGCAIGSFALVYAVHLLSPLHSDGLIGLSGGLGGLLGWFVVSNFRCREVYPQHFYLTSLFFALITLIVLPLFISFTTFLCHGFGMVLGGLAALFVDKETFIKQYLVSR
ncbi:MAG: rhomboid family intramembrane serine protease [Proteobacteria bacterium]|nr:rhomboid family intramembrane serine protease [Pseudomonadota bacterium]